MNEDKGGDGEDLKAEVTIMDKDYRERIQKDEHEAVPRRMYISKDYVEVHGYTQRCPGCVAILRGTANQAHSVGCRKILEEAMSGTEKAERAKRKVGEFVDKKMGEEEEVRKKKMIKKI